MSDSLLDEVQRFEDARDEELMRKAGFSNRNNDNEDEFSDEEVMSLAGSESEEEDQEAYYDAADTKKNRLDKENDWGSRKDNYYGGADDVGAEDDASVDEEQEALAVHQRQLAAMDENDFYDESDMEGWKKDADSQDFDLAGFQEDQLPQQDPLAMSGPERLEFIEENYPEVLLLSKELRNCLNMQEEIAKITDEKIAGIQNVALRSYMAMIYAYFALFAERVKEGPVDLKQHPVMEGILKARELWQTAKRLDGMNFDLDSEHQSESDSNDRLTEALMPSAAVESEGDASSDQVEALNSDDSNEFGSTSASELESDPESEMEEEDDFTIPLPSKESKARKTKSTVKSSDYDETADTVEQQARAKNKQSLRFYTSQVGRKNAAKDTEFQGDMDIPYKERAFERRQRLLEEARLRGQMAKDQLGVSDDEEETRENQSQSSNSLYGKIKQKHDDAKSLKRTQHKEALEAAREGRIAEYLAENPSVDKRAINYQIEKNKGLTKHRKKENRNARVKKRLRYEQAKKKLGSVRRVYKEPTGPYGGELTGIRKNLSHSTRFNN